MGRKKSVGAIDGDNKDVRSMAYRSDGMSRITTQKENACMHIFNYELDCWRRMCRRRLGSYWKGVATRAANNVKLVV